MSGLSRLALLARLEEKMLEALKKYATEKAYFARLSRAYDNAPREIRGRIIDRENQKQGDPARKAAAQQAEWYRDEAAMYASVIQAMAAVHQLQRTDRSTS